MNVYDFDHTIFWDIDGVHWYHFYSKGVIKWIMD